MAFTKFASFEVSEIMSVKGAPSKQRTATLDKVADYADFRTGDGYLYARIKAISSRVNKNHDGWPSIELAGGEDAWKDITAKHQAGGSIVAEAKSERKQGYSTFVGKPIFVDHHNSDPKRARGVIVDSKLHVLDHKTAAEHDDYWSSDSVDPEHAPATEVELLLEVDAKSFPKLAEAIIKGSENPDDGIDGFSMGCDVEYSKCSHCGNKATNPDEYCSHIKMKGAELKVEAGRHTGSSRKSYENCYGIHFFEISAVFDPADETALTQEIINEKRQSHTAAGIAGEPELPGEFPEQGASEPRYQLPNFVDDGANMMAQGNPTNLLQRAQEIAAQSGLSVAEAMVQAGQEGQTPVGGDGGGLPNMQIPQAPQPLGPMQNNPLTGSYLSHRTADNPEPQEDHIKAPENVDTLREEKICPICGSDMDSDKCDVCGYDEPPEQMQNPDLTKHDQMGEEADGLVDDPAQDPAAQGELGMDNKQPGSYLENRKSPQTPAVNNAAPAPALSHVASAGGDEPSDETVKSDQTTPVTSAFRTAQDLIRATKENRMATQRLAGEPADPSGQPDKRVDVEGVGGVMQDSNVDASKPDATTTVDGKGGVYQDSNAEASKPDGKESLPTAGKDTNDSGFNKDKTTGDSGKTRTWDNSNEPGSAVTSDPFPDTTRGAARQAGDDRPFPHNEDALAQGGSAKQGVKPNGGADVQPQRRENVLEHKTTPDNNSGPTDTWSGTGGNGVTKQQEPVTRKVDPNIDVKKSFTLAALKLAETEIELGLLDPDKKFDRLVELQDTDDAVVNAQQTTLARVKTAGIRKNAATEPQGLGKLPAFNRIGSAVDAAETTRTASVDDGVLDSALFG